MYIHIVTSMIGILLRCGRIQMNRYIFYIEYKIYVIYLFIYLFIYLAMAKYCVKNRKEHLDEINENRNSVNKKSKHGGTSTYNIKECFEEYSLEDKVEALKNILSHNGKLKQNEPSNINNILHIKKPIGVKECLQANQETPFQTLIFELKNTVMNSYWNKEVGKTCYQVPNLPVGMNPLETTFGKRIEPGETVAKILHEKMNKNNILEKEIVEMYKKSHNSYLPAEQIKRHYKSPFNENLYFGKPINIRTKGTGVKKLLKWINVDTHTIIDSEFSDFKEHSHSNVEEASNLNNTPVCTNMEHDTNKRTDKEEIRNVFNECSLNDETIKQYNYLQYINNLRLKLKKRIPEIQFVDIFEDLLYFDKDYIEILPADKIFPILAKYKIYVNEVLLMPLLDLLQIRKGKTVNYRALLNLLNWRYDFPTLPKIEKLPLDCQYYNTTYNETIGNLQEINTTSISAAGIPSKNMEDNKTTAYSLIFPNIFTRYGLSQLDLSKPRSKEEVKSIFENIEIQFPNNSFDLLWEEGLKKSGENNLSIEAFNNLFDQYNY